MVLARQQQEAAGRAAATGIATTVLPAAAGLAAASGRLSHLFMVLEQRRRSAGVTAAGRRLGLRLSSLPSRLLQVPLLMPPLLLIIPVVFIGLLPPLTGASSDANHTCCSCHNIPASCRCLLCCQSFLSSSLLPLVFSSYRLL